MKNRSSAGFVTVRENQPENFCYLDIADSLFRKQLCDPLLSNALTYN